GPPRRAWPTGRGRYSNEGYATSPVPSQSWPWFTSSFACQYTQIRGSEEDGRRGLGVALVELLLPSQLASEHEDRRAAMAVEGALADAVLQHDLPGRHPEPVLLMEDVVLQRFGCARTGRCLGGLQALDGRV